MAVEELRIVREQINGVWHSIHVSADGRVRFDFGHDDQRPNEDGTRYIQPICVAEIMPSGDVWNYHQFCGACHRRMGSLGEIKEHCPRCGMGIAHFVFAFGVTNYHRDWRSKMPDQLTDITAGAVE